MKSNLSRSLVLAAAVVASFGFGAVAIAATATDNLSVTATVVPDCTISTTTLAFGNYSPVTTHASGGTDLDGTGAVTITCTLGDAVEVTLGQGANAGGGSTDAAPVRRMNDGGTNYLSYDLYSDAGRTAIWGNDATVDVPKTGTGAADALTVYGRVPKGQNANVGSYTDTVVATVTF